MRSLTARGRSSQPGGYLVREPCGDEVGAVASRVRHRQPYARPCAPVDDGGWGASVPTGSCSEVSPRRPPIISEPCLLLDDGGADFEIACVKEFSVEPNATVGPIDHRAAIRACSTTYRLYKAPRPTDPESLARTTGPHRSAHRSGRRAIRGPWSRRGDG